MGEAVSSCEEECQILHEEELAVEDVSWSSQGGTVEEKMDMVDKLQEVELRIVEVEWGMEFQNRKVGDSCN